MGGLVCRGQEARKAWVDSQHGDTAADSSDVEAASGTTYPRVVIIGLIQLAGSCGGEIAQ